MSSHMAYTRARTHIAHRSFTATQNVSRRLGILNGSWMNDPNSGHFVGKIITANCVQTMTPNCFEITKWRNGDNEQQIRLSNEIDAVRQLFDFHHRKRKWCDESWLALVRQWDLDTRLSSAIRNNWLDTHRIISARKNHFGIDSTIAYLYVCDVWHVQFNSLANIFLVFPLYSRSFDACSVISCEFDHVSREKTTRRMG